MPPKGIRPTWRPSLAHQSRLNLPRLRPSSTTSHPSTPASPTPHPPKRKANYPRRALLWSLTSLLFGLAAGNFVAHTIAPPPHPDPGSSGDELLMHDLQGRIDGLFKVRVLRGKCASPGAKLRGEDGGCWVEVREQRQDQELGRRGGDHEARERDEGLRQQAEALGLEFAASEGRVKGMVQGAMAGARALGVERCFWNARDGELVAVVWIGGGLSGWPGVAHGGAIATVLEEKATSAARLFRAGYAEGEIRGGGTGSRPTPREVELVYKKPTHANDFYLLRITPRFAVAEGLSTAIKSLGREIEVEGKLETMDGKTCVEYKAIVPVGDGSEGATGMETAKAAVKSSSWSSWLR